MQKRLHHCLALCIAALMAFATTGAGIARDRPDKKIPIDEVLKRPYLDLFELASVPYTATQK
jgi:hypothetical protein